MAKLVKVYSATSPMALYRTFAESGATFKSIMNAVNNVFLSNSFDKSCSLIYFDLAHIIPINTADDLEGLKIACTEEIIRLFFIRGKPSEDELYPILTALYPETHCSETVHDDSENEHNDAVTPNNDNNKLSTTMSKEDSSREHSATPERESADGYIYTKSSTELTAAAYNCVKKVNEARLKKKPNSSGRYDPKSQVPLMRLVGIIMNERERRGCDGYDQTKLCNVENILETLNTPFKDFFPGRMDKNVATWIRDHRKLTESLDSD